jgi:hypothetical protein
MKRRIKNPGVVQIAKVLHPASYSGVQGNRSVITQSEAVDGATSP